MGKFADDIAKFNQRAKGRMDDVTREVVGQLALSVILKSPVGDPSLWQGKAPKGYVGGRFRANWRLGVGAINKETTTNIDADGGSTLDNIVGSIPQDAAGKVYYITNSLPYAIPLENGHSKQAPFGMVTLTVIEYSQVLKRALTAINGRAWS